MKQDSARIPALYLIESAWQSTPASMKRNIDTIQCIPCMHARVMYTNSILWRYGDAFLICRSITPQTVVKHDVYSFDQCIMSGTIRCPENARVHEGSRYVSSIEQNYSASSVLTVISPIWIRRIGRARSHDGHLLTKVTALTENCHVFHVWFTCEDKFQKTRES